MDSKRKMENTLEDIVANHFSGGDYEEIYIIMNSGILLSQEPINFDQSIPSKLASSFLSMEAVCPIRDMRVRSDDAVFYLSRLNDRSFIAVKAKEKAAEDETREKMDQVSAAVKESIPWLR